MNNKREICIDLFNNKDEKSPFEISIKSISSQISNREENPNKIIRQKNETIYLKDEIKSENFNNIIINITPKKFIRR